MHINLLQTDSEQAKVPHRKPPCLLFHSLAPQRPESNSVTVCPFELGKLQSAGQPFWQKNGPTWTCAVPHNNPGISKYPSCRFSCGGWSSPCRDLHLQSCISLFLFKIVVTFAFLPNFTHFPPCPSPPTLVSHSILLSVRASHLSRWHLMWGGAQPMSLQPLTHKNTHVHGGLDLDGKVRTSLWGPNHPLSLSGSLMQSDLIESVCCVVWVC